MDTQEYNRIINSYMLGGLSREQAEERASITFKTQLNTDIAKSDGMLGVLNAETLKELGRDIIRTPVRLGENVAAFGRQLAGQSFEEATAPRYSNLLGEEITPIGTRNGGGLSRENLVESLGAGLELSSFIPVTRGVQALNQTARQAIGSGVRRIGAEGAVGGGLYSAGSQLINEGTIDPLQLAGDVALGGAFGGALGGVGAVPGAVRRSLTELMDQTADRVGNIGNKTTQFRRSFGAAEPETVEQAKEVLFDAYKSAFIDDQVAINNRLSKLGRKSNSDTDTLVRNLVGEGYAPDIEGKLSKMDDVLDDITKRQVAISEQINDTISTYDTRISIDNFIDNIADELRRSELVSAADLTKSLAELRRIRQGFITRYGDEITPYDLNRIRVDMNRRTGAFNTEVFQEDVSNTIARKAREEIDRIVPDEVIRNANAEWGRLQTLKETAEIFDNKPVRVNELGKTLGSFTGVTGAALAGLTLAGPGGLLVAGLAAKYGGDVLAQFLRSKKFSKRAQDIIRESLKSNPNVIDDLVKTASEQRNKNYLGQLLLEAPSNPELRTQIGSRETIALPQSIRETNLGLDELRGLSTFNPAETAIVSQVDNTLLNEAKKYKSAEEFVNKVDITNTPEFKKWAGNNKVVEVYHGSPNEFDKFDIGDNLYNVSGQTTSGISFADNYKNAEPFSRQYSERYNKEYYILSKKYKDLYEAEKSKINVSSESIFELKNELKNIFKENNIKLDDKMTTDEANALITFFGNRELKNLSPKNYETLKDLAFGNKENLQKISDLKNKEVLNLDKKYANEGKVYKAYLKGKIVEVNGEDIGFGASRNELVDSLKSNEILKINNADTGQYLGTEYMTNNPNNIFIVNAGKTKSQLTDIWNKANKNNADDALIQEARKYKSAEEFVESQRKLAQLDAVNRLNPMTDSYHTGIRSIDDIKTFREVIDDGESFVYPDFTREMAEKSLKSGEITIYSSKPLDNNTAQFVTPSKMGATDYAGDGKVYSKTVKLDEIAWINGDEGQLVGDTKSQLTDIWKKANK